MCKIGRNPQDTVGTPPQIPHTPNAKKRLGLVIPFQFVESGSVRDILNQLEKRKTDDLIDTIYLDVFYKGKTHLKNPYFIDALRVVQQWQMTKKKHPQLYYDKKVFARISCFNWHDAPPPKDWRMYDSPINLPNDEPSWWLTPWKAIPSKPLAGDDKEPPPPPPIYSEIARHTKANLSLLFKEFPDLRLAGISLININVPFQASEKPWVSNGIEYAKAISSFVQEMSTWAKQQRLLLGIDYMSQKQRVPALQNYILEDLQTHNSWDCSLQLDTLDNIHSLTAEELNAELNLLTNFQSETKLVYGEFELFPNGQELPSNLIKLIYQVLHKHNGSILSLNPNYTWQEQINTIFDKISDSFDKIEIQFKTQNGDAIPNVVVQIEDNYQNPIELNATDAEGTTTFRTNVEEPIKVIGVVENTLMGRVVNSTIEKIS